MCGVPLADGYMVLCYLSDKGWVFRGGVPYRVETGIEPPTPVGVFFCVDFSNIWWMGGRLARYPQRSLDPL